MEENVTITLSRDEMGLLRQCAALGLTVATAHPSADSVNGAPTIHRMRRLLAMLDARIGRNDAPMPTVERDGDRLIVQL